MGQVQSVPLAPGVKGKLIIPDPAIVIYDDSKVDPEKCWGIVKTVVSLVGPMGPNVSQQGPHDFEKNFGLLERQCRNPHRPGDGFCLLHSFLVAIDSYSVLKWPSEPLAGSRPASSFRNLYEPSPMEMLREPYRTLALQWLQTAEQEKLHLLQDPDSEKSKQLLAQLYTDIVDKKPESQSLQQLSNAIHSEYDYMRKDNGRLRDQVTTVTSELEGKVQQKDTQIQNNNQKIHNLQAELERKAELEKVLETNKKDLEQLREKLEESNGLVEKYEDVTLPKYRSDFEQQKLAKKAQIELLDQERVLNDDLKQQVEELKQARDSTAKELKQLKEKLAEVQPFYERLQTQVAQEQKNNAEVQANLERLQTQVAQEQKINAELQANLEEREEKYTKLRQHYNRERREQRSANEEALAAIDRYQGSKKHEARVNRRKGGGAVGRSAASTIGRRKRTFNKNVEDKGAVKRSSSGRKRKGPRTESEDDTEDEQPKTKFQATGDEESDAPTDVEFTGTDEGSDSDTGTDGGSDKVRKGKRNKGSKGNPRNKARKTIRQPIKSDDDSMDETNEENTGPK